MNQVRDSEYYFAEAERCLRWSRLQHDLRKAAELEALADEYARTAWRLQSIERAPFRDRALTD